MNMTIHTKYANSIYMNQNANSMSTNFLVEIWMKLKSPNNADRYLLMQK